MSQATREAISEALNAIEGINCTPYYRQFTRPGDGVVRRDRMNVQSRISTVDTWQIWIALPKDIADSERWVEDHEQAIFDALYPAQMSLTSMTFQQVPVGTVLMNVVIFEGTRASD